MSEPIKPPACPRVARPPPTRQPRPPPAASGNTARQGKSPQIVQLALEGHSHYANNRFTGLPRRTVDRWLAQQRRTWAKAGEQTQETESRQNRGLASNHAEERTEEKLDFAPNRPLENPTAAAPATEKKGDGDIRKAADSRQRQSTEYRESGNEFPHSKANTHRSGGFFIPSPLVFKPIW